MPITTIEPTEVIDDNAISQLIHNTPDHVYILSDGTRHGIYCVRSEGLHGLMASEDRDVIEMICNTWEFVMFKPVRVEFDHALDIAKSKPESIKCVFVFMDMSNWETFYVR